MSLVPNPKGCDPSVKKAIQILASIKLGPTSEPTFAGLTVNGTGTFEKIIINGTVDIGLDMSSGTFATTDIKFSNATELGDSTFQIDDANYNMRLGTDTFNNADGQYNIGIGYRAGYNLDDTGGLGKQNIYIGAYAGYGETDGILNTGDYNVAIGKDCLRKNTTGGRNVAVGFQALQNNTEGEYNVAVGTNCMNDNTTGYYNTCIGYHALRLNTSGYGNVSMGYTSLGANTSGYNNVAIGTSVMGFNTEGRDNIAINYLACRNNTTGDKNIGIGTWALRHNQTGDSNVAVGRYSCGSGGSGNNSLSYNTIIGAEAGYLLTTGNSNIFLGYQAGLWQTTLGNRLIIDNQSRGSAAAEITDCFIYGVFHATPANQSLRFNVGTTIWGNPTHSDADGGGAILQQFVREDGAGTATTMFQVETSHDGAGVNDQKGKMVLSVNTGAGLVESMRLDSTGLAAFTGGVQLTGGDIITTTANGNISFIPNGSGITIIGNAGGTSHSLNTNDDLLVSGKLEVNGVIYADWGVEYNTFGPWTHDNITHYFGTGYDVAIDWSRTQATSHSFVIGLGNTSQSVIFTKKANIEKDFDHAAQSNPTIFVQSTTNPDTANDEWISLTHDTNNGVITTGVGDLILNPNSGNWVINKTSGVGIKVDIATPTFGWADLQGIVTNSKGPTKPSEATYRGTITEFQFSAGDDAEIDYHIPHDHVPGTDIYLHVHWSHIGGFVTGGTLTFTVESCYAKGHNQAAFSAPVTGTFVGTASTQYQHIVSETQYSASAPAGLQIDTDDLEPDGIILMRFEMTTNNMTVSEGLVPDPFIHHIDVHYQTTGLIGTKQKAPNFYV